MKKILSLFLSLVLVTGIVLLVRNTGTSSGVPTSENTSTSDVSSNVIMRDGIQYITIDVKRGYSPRSTRAQGGVPTRLIAKTQESYGCETALVIRSVGFQEYLPATANTEIDLGTPSSGTTTNGTCSMGMYGFRIEYI